MICPTGIAKYFCEKDWTTQISLNPQTKFDFTRTRFFHRLRLAFECIRYAGKIFGEKRQLPLIECSFDGLIDATKRRFNPLQCSPALSGRPQEPGSHIVLVAYRSRSPIDSSRFVIADMPDSLSPNCRATARCVIGPWAATIERTAACAVLTPAAANTARSAAF